MKSVPDKFDAILIKLMVLGDSNVGKTSFIHRYVDEEFTEKYTTTVGIDFREKNLELPNENRRIKLQIWDTAGQERYRSLSTSFYRDAMGFVLLFDVTNYQSFLNVSHWIVELKTHTYTCTPKVILCGNKVDLTSERRVDSLLVTKLSKDFNLTYIETSAFTGEGLNEAMEAIGKLVVDNIDGVINAFNPSVQLQRARLFSATKDTEDWDTTLEEWQYSRESSLPNCCR